MTGLTSWDSTAINAWIHVPGAATQLKNRIDIYFNERK